MEATEPAISSWVASASTLLDIADSVAFVCPGLGPCWQACACMALLKLPPVLAQVLCALVLAGWNLPPTKWCLHPPNYMPHHCTSPLFGKYPVEASQHYLDCLHCGSQSPLAPPPKHTAVLP
eukprot:GHUV01027362.1.p1 GENE.GHUV01027362.1~~GHUV01027362.1.p1  ORF type:complete len:122 (+),score=4.41 GHUV01027362.1:479-844(+)